MANLKVNIAGVEFKNPIITASGCFGFGREYEKMYPLEKLGGMSLKGTTYAERLGNPPPRIAETASGMLNSVGLQNPGVKHFIREELPYLLDKGTVIIANAAGSALEDYRMLAEELDQSAVDMIELNISCPNVKSGGMTFGASCESASEIVREIRKATSKPLMVKLSPNVTDIVSIAQSVEAEGADAVSLINTLVGMRIDIESRRPILHQNTGGLSGPAVFPVALAMVWKVANAVKIPVVGLGGVEKWQDAIEMMLAGATGVQVGTAMFYDPYAPLKIIEGMNEWLDRNGIADVGEIIGQVRPW